VSAARIAAYRAAVDQVEQLVTQGPSEPLQAWMDTFDSSVARADSLFHVALDPEQDSLDDLLAFIAVGRSLTALQMAAVARVETAWMDGLR
jgi:hypothetical protein